MGALVVVAIVLVLVTAWRRRRSREVLLIDSLIGRNRATRVGPKERP